MFGELALSERAIADHSILTLGSATADANFTLGQAATYIGVGEVDIEAISSKASIGSGILAGSTDILSEFDVSSNLTRFATGISANVVSFDQSTSAQRFATGISEQSFEFDQASSANKIVSGKSDQSFEFEQTSIPIVISNSSTDMSFEFYSEIVPSIIKSGLLEVVSTFDLIQTSGILIYRNNFNVDFAFAMSTNGALLWERINANTPSEAWTQVNVSGGSWTPINASGTIETWIEKVV